MQAVQDEGHMRAGLGERSTIRATDAAGADPSDLHLLILSPAGSWLEKHAAAPVNATEYVQIRMAIRRRVEAE